MMRRPPAQHAGRDRHRLRTSPLGWWRRFASAWTSSRGDANAATAPLMEEYEPRLLYSADLAAAAGLVLTPGAPATEVRMLDAAGEYVVGTQQVAAQALELVFIDAAVEDKNSFINQIDTNDGRCPEVIVLEAGRDGVAQISAALTGRSDVAAVHIVSHGAEGEIRLGSSVLDATQLAARSGEIAQWGAALGADADVLLYGCDVAAGSVGEAFVRQLAQLTRADVAASSDVTGNASLGGDWTLEVAVGRVQTASLITAAGNAWSGTLATFVVTDKNGSGPGTLPQAIADANAAAGADTIVFQVSGAGAPVINIDTPLIITDTITIDGTRNNGVLSNGGLPGVILDGGGLAAHGLTLADGADGSTIRGLVIRDFAGNGIEIASGADGNTIADNYVGNLWEDSTRAGSNDNGGAGIHISSRFNTIGGTGVSDRNVIGGNGGPGILIENPAGAVSLVANNQIVGNTIGTERDGVSALPNSVGILLRDGAQWDRILGNSITRNTGSGIVVGDITGAAVHDLLIGDSGSDANTIALNGGDGVTVVSGIHNTIVSNSIFGNAGLGIDLRNLAASSGVTANDSGDADSGGNELQNFPVLSSAQAVSGTQIRVIGTLNAAASTQHLVEFFSNTTADPSGNGEGQTFLGSITVTTNGSGIASFNTLINATLPAGSIISATATNYYTFIIVPVRGSTSEFSNNVVLDNAAPVLDASKSPQLISVPASAAAPVGAVGTLVSALVDFALPAGQLDNVTDANSGALLGIAITGEDTVNGTLYYTTNAGSTWTAVGAVSASNALLLAADGSTRIYYRANAGASGTLASAATFRAWDRTTGTAGTFMDTSTNGGATAFSVATDTAALTVTAVNGAPVNTVPGAQSVNEDTALAIGGISVNDANGNLASTQLTVTSGVLNVGLSGGAVIIAGANGSADLTLGGTQAQIDAALATLTYQGNSNFAGSDTLRVLSTDGAVTPLSDTDTIAITVNAVNDPPVAAGGAVTGAEDTAYVFTWADFNVSDVDTAISGATAVRVDVLPVSGVLEYFNGAKWTPVALGQLVSKASIDGGALRFTPASDESGHDGYAAPGVGNLLQDYARFSFTPVQSAVIAIVNPDGEANGLADGASQNPATAWVTSGANAGALNPAASAYALDHDAVLFVDAGATLTQTLATPFTSARNYSLSFEFGWRGDAGFATEPGFRVELWAGATLMGSMDQTAIAGIQGEFVSGVLAMTGTASGAVEGSALQVRLIGTSLQANFDNLRLISFAATGDIGSAVIMNIDIVPVNDAPTATNLNTAESYTEDTGLNLTNIVISDIDSANVTATLTLSNTAAGSLSTATAGAVTSIYIAGTGVWTASGALADVNTLLAGVSFNPAANFNGSFTIATSVSDGVAPALTGSKAITGIAVNDAPTATNLSAAETYTEDTALNLSNIVISDIDSANVTATLTLSNTAAGSLSTATAGAVTSTYVAGTGVWTASGALADVNTLLAGVSFNPAANFNGGFTIATSVSDGVAPAITGSKAITGIAVNDAPTATNLSAAETYTEDTALNLSNIVISDIDSANVTATLTLSNTAAGSLSTGTAGAVTSTYVAGTGVWTASGALADVNTLLAGVSFNPAANFNGSFTIGTSVSDGVAPAVTGSKALTSIAVNDAPIATITPLTYSATEQVNLTLSGTGISVADVDAGAAVVQVSLSIASGTLIAAGGSTGVAISSVGLTLIFNGNINQINNLLAGSLGSSLSYVINADVPPASDTLILQISDLGNTGGAALTSQDTAVINIAAVNDAPTATNLSAAETYTEDTALNLTNIVISDIDSANVTATLTLSNTAAGSLSTATAGAVTSTYNAATGVWTASGALADVNTLLAGVSFNPAANFNGSFTIASNVSDGVAPALTGSKAITGIAVNDAPTATNLSAAETYTEDSTLNFTDIVISDIDSANVTATLTLSNAAAGNLSTATAGAVTSTYVAGTGVWTASGALADVNTLLAGVSFNPAANFNGSFTIASNVSDGVAPALTGSKAITGIAVNDAPTATNLSAAETYTEDSTLNFTDIVISDIDSANVTATLTLSNTAAGSLSTATAGAVTSTYNAATGVWTASGALADVNTLLAGVSFNPAANFNGSFTIASSVSDGVAPALTGSKAITGIAVNDAPTAAIALTSYAATEQVDLALQGTGLSVTDVDAGAGVVQVTLGVLSGVLSAAAGSTGVTLGTTGTTLTLIGNINQINNLLSGIGGGTLTYIANSDTPPASDTLTLRIDDQGNSGGGSLTAQVTVTLNIAALNDAPVASALTLTAVAEDSAVRVITATELLAGATDVDSPALTITALTIAAGSGILVDNGNGTWNYTPALNDDTAVTFTYTASDGTLTASSSAALDITPVNDAALIGGVSGGTVTEDAATPNLTASGTLTITDADAGESQFVAQTGTPGTLGTFALNSAGDWRYTADNAQAAIQRLAAGATLSETFTVTSVDGTASRNVVITITGVNDAPLASDQAFTTANTVSQVFGVNDFGYSDPDGDALAVVRITSLPGSGVLLLNSAPVAVGQDIAAAAIAAGSLRFVPNENNPAAVATAFAFQVSDGTAYSTASHTVSITVTPGVLRDENGAVPQPAPVSLPVQTPGPSVVASPVAAAASGTGGSGENGAAIAPPAPAPVPAPATLLDGLGFGQAASRVDTTAEALRVRSAGASQAPAVGALAFTLGLGVTEVRNDPFRLLDVSTGERAAAATVNAAFVEALDRLRDNARADEILERNIIVSSVATGAGMSVGYVLWLLRGGLLLSSLLSSLPAWRFVDPLPVLGRLRDEDEDGEDADDESVESMVQASGGQAETR